MFGRPICRPKQQGGDLVLANGHTPLRDFMSLRDAMDRFFDDRWVSPGPWLTWAGAGTQSLPIDIYETPDDIVVRALVPGVNPENIDIQYQGGVLTVRTKTEPYELEASATAIVNEISVGQAVRQVSLPRTVEVEKATTDFENGVLILTLPKSADAKPKQIKVGSAPQIGAGTTAS
jgi:HSP20 family protein